MPSLACSSLTRGLQRLGRKTLLSFSASGAFLSLVGVGYGLDAGVVALASVTILTFVAYVTADTLVCNIY